MVHQLAARGKNWIGSREGESNQIRMQLEGSTAGVCPQTLRHTVLTARIPELLAPLQNSGQATTSACLPLLFGNLSLAGEHQGTDDGHELES